MQIGNQTYLMVINLPPLNYGVCFALAKTEFFKVRPEYFKLTVG
jgi:hypothetical protein